MHLKMQMTSIDTKMNCASCGKEGGNLNTCNKCKMVTYCNAACKKKHRSKHKKACESRVAELYDEALFKEHPPTDDCPICFLPLPLDPTLKTFKSCCGKIICRGCIYVMQEEARGRGKIDLCAFCRKPNTIFSEDEIKQLKKLMEVGNADAFYQHAGYYYYGLKGMPQDIAKANDLYLRAGELGCAMAYCNIGHSYINGIGVDVDKKKGRYFYELAAIDGDVRARHNLGTTEGKSGNIDRAKKHFILAAKAGDKKSLDKVKAGFMKGIVTKDEYEHTLRAYQNIHDEMKSEDRDKVQAELVHSLSARASTRVHWSNRKKGIGM